MDILRFTTADAISIFSLGAVWVILATATVLNIYAGNRTLSAILGAATLAAVVAVVLLIATTNHIAGGG